MDGPRAKLDAAEDHFKTLDEHIGAFLRSEPYDVTIEFDDREGYRFVVVAHVHETPPLKISTLIGDVVHNLASALDHTAYELARMRSGRPVEMTSFPIYADIRDYRKFRRRRNCWLRCLTIKDRAYLQRLQPYRGGDLACLHPLTTLYLLWNQDKHRVLHTTLSFLSAASFKMTALQDIAWVGPFMGRFGRFEDGTRIAYMMIGPDGPSPKVQVEGKLEMSVAFDNGLNVIETLADVGNWVIMIVEEFAKQFP